MGLAEELKADQASRKNPAPPVAQEAKSSEATNVDAVEHFALEGESEIELPTGGKPEAVVAEEAVVPKVRIAGKDFASVEEAIKYAEQLELEKLTNAAYAQGKEDSLPKTAQEPEEDPILKAIEDDLFVDPKKAINKIFEVAAQKAQETLDKRDAQKAEQAALVQAREAAVTDFYSKNPDLADFKEIVDFTIDKNMKSLGKLSPEKAFEEVAKMARKTLGMAKEASLPTKELSSKSAVVGASTGSPGTPMASKQAPSTVDFITQINKHRKRN